MRMPKVDLNVSASDFTPPPTPPPSPENLITDEEKKAKNFAILQKQSLLVRSFWELQMKEIENIKIVYKGDHPFPLATIKRVMKSNEEVKMITAEAPVVLAKACELFIMELTLRGWLQTKDCQRRTLQRWDIARAVALDEIFDFLVDFVPYYDDDCHQQDESEKPNEKVEILPAKRLHSSGIDINEEFIPDEEPEAHEQPNKMKPSLSFANFDHGSTSKMRKMP